jgi:hypothetical protein
MTPGPVLTLPPKSPQGSSSESLKPPHYAPEDVPRTLATIMGAHPDKHITRFLKQAGQHTGNSIDESIRLQRILTILKETTLKHTRVSLYGTAPPNTAPSSSERPDLCALYRTGNRCSAWESKEE